MNDQPARQLNSQHLDALAKTVREHITTTIARLEMRKFAVQTAAELWLKPDFQSPPFCTDEKGVIQKLSGVAYTPVELANMIYDFMTAPAAEIVVKIEQ